VFVTVVRVLESAFSGTLLELALEFLTVAALTSVPTIVCLFSTFASSSFDILARSLSKLL
jgi:hypothetical protein